MTDVNKGHRSYLNSFSIVWVCDMALADDALGADRYVYMEGVYLLNWKHVTVSPPPCKFICYPIHRC